MTACKGGGASGDSTKAVYQPLNDNSQMDFNLAHLLPLLSKCSVRSRMAHI